MGPKSAALFMLADPSPENIENVLQSIEAGGITWLSEFAEAGGWDALSRFMLNTVTLPAEDKTPSLNQSLALALNCCEAAAASGHDTEAEGTVTSHMVGHEELLDALAKCVRDDAAQVRGAALEALSVMFEEADEEAHAVLFKAMEKVLASKRGEPLAKELVNSLREEEEWGLVEKHVTLINAITCSAGERRAGGTESGDSTGLLGGEGGRLLGRVRFRAELERGGMTEVLTAVKKGASLEGENPTKNTLHLLAALTDFEEVADRDEELTKRLDTTHALAMLLSAKVGGTKGEGVLVELLRHLIAMPDETVRKNLEELEERARDALPSIFQQADRKSVV